ncbi:hypothetical protein HHI36_007244 [Cryptolaemus montrouzieri]|uniref:Uncharacterized protein n=1 Tax=Cryptolaemus montrouzieri TaxID=559131 RepID=A0ABD2MP27_9CUCU
MYVIFPADEIVYLSYGRVIYIPSRSPPPENQVTAPARTSYSSGSHASYPSIPSVSTNSSTRSHHSTKSLPVEPCKSAEPPKANSLTSLTQSTKSNSDKTCNTPPIRPKRKKEFPFKLPNLLQKSKPKTPSLERKLSFSDFVGIANERRERSSESVGKYSSDIEYQTARRSKNKQEHSDILNGIESFPSARPSILKTGKCAGAKSNRSPCLMIRETDVFNFEQPSTSKARSTSSSPNYNDESTFRPKSNSEVSGTSSAKSVNAKPVRKISSEKSPQIKITSDKSQRLREKTPSGGGRGMLTRSFSLKPNSSQYFSENPSFSASFDRDYREVTPPTNSSREKSPPNKIPSDKKQLSKSLYNKPVKLLKKPLQLSKSFKEITTPPPVKTPTSPNPSKKSPSSKSLTVDFDSLFLRETSPAKISLKNLAPKFEDESRLDVCRSG